MRNDGDSKKRRKCISSLPLSALVRDVWVTWQHKMLAAEVPSAALKLVMHTFGYFKIIGQITLVGWSRKYRTLTCMELGSWLVVWERMPEWLMEYQSALHILTSYICTHASVRYSLF